MAHVHYKVAHKARVALDGGVGAWDCADTHVFGHDSAVHAVYDSTFSVAAAAYCSCGKIVQGKVKGAFASCGSAWEVEPCVILKLALAQDFSFPACVFLYVPVTGQAERRAVIVVKVAVDAVCASAGVVQLYANRLIAAVAGLGAQHDVIVVGGAGKSVAVRPVISTPGDVAHPVYCLVADVGYQKLFYPVIVDDGIGRVGKLNHFLHRAGAFLRKRDCFAVVILGDKFHLAYGSVCLVVINIDLKAGSFSVSHGEQVVLAAPAGPLAVRRKKVYFWLNAFVDKAGFYGLAPDFLVTVLGVCGNNVDCRFLLVFVEGLDGDCSRTVPFILLFIAECGVQLGGNNLYVGISRIYRIFKGTRFVRGDYTKSILSPRNGQKKEKKSEI